MVNCIFFLFYLYKNKYSKPSTFKMEQNFQDFFFYFQSRKHSHQTLINGNILNSCKHCIGTVVNFYLGKKEKKGVLTFAVCMLSFQTLCKMFNQVIKFKQLCVEGWSGCIFSVLQIQKQRWRCSVTCPELCREVQSL